MTTATHESSQTISLPADEVERITDRQLAEELANGVQALVDALSLHRWCFACTASTVGGGARGGCRTCWAFLAGVQLVAKAKAVRS